MLIPLSLTQSATASSVPGFAKSRALTKRLIVGGNDRTNFQTGGAFFHRDSIAVGIAAVVHVDRKILDAIDGPLRALELPHGARRETVERQRILP